jgi:hypothetical protein
VITYRGEQFSGYNKPKRTPKHPNKSHAVLAKEGETIKLIRFGQQGVSGSPEQENQQRTRRRASAASNIERQDVCCILGGRNGKLDVYLSIRTDC